MSPPVRFIQNIILLMMINRSTANALQNERFRAKLQDSMPNYAYEVLLLQIIVEDDEYPRKPTIDQISKLIQLYMLAVQVLESSADTRYDYFKRKIHSLMMKKHIIEQMHMASGKPVSQQTLEQCERAELDKRKYQYEAQIYFNKTDNSKVQEILKKAEIQVKTLNTNLRKNIISQQQKLEERIKNRKMKSQSGSVNKYKIGSHNAHAKDVDTPPRKVDPRMEYFDDYNEKDVKPTTPVTSKNIKNNFGLAQKADLARRNKIFM